MSEGTEETVPTEVLAETPAVVEPEAPVEETETAAGEQSEPVVEEEESEETKVKRESGYARMKRQRDLERQEKEYAQERVRQFEQAKTAPKQKPKEADYDGNWGEYIADTAAWKISEGLAAENAEKEKVAHQARVAELQAEVTEKHLERLSAFKAKVKDFDQVTAAIQADGSISEAVASLLVESKLGPDIAYFLGKNPVIRAKLNSLTPLQAAVEIGAIQYQLSDTSRKPTQAKAPIIPPKGGASGAFDPATASMDEYVAKRKAGWGK